MTLFKGTRLLFGRIALNKRLKKIRRNKKFNNLRTSHKIGIVWDGSDTSDFEGITSFYQDMKDINIQVDIICYYPDNILPDEYTAIRYLSCLKKSDLNFFYIPQNYDIEEFINTPYDILIDINIRNHFPIEYISVLSRAEFKVGPDTSKYKDKLDMTIKISDNDAPTYYLNQVRYYLEMINTGT